MKRSIPLLVAGTCLLAVSAFTSAQVAYPEKPIRIIVPFAAGGATDALLRQLQEPVGKLMGQPIVVENRPGAAGAIAARYVAESAADGYTLLVVNSGLVAITPSAQKNPGFDSVKSFTPVAGLSSAPSVLLVHPSVPADNVRQFIDYAKANPDKIDYAVVGKGAYGDLATALFSRQAGIRMIPVPYQGNAQTTTALLSGEVKAQLTILSGATNEHIRSGKIKALGVATTAPTTLVPGVMAIADVVPGFEAVVYTGLLAPARTPPAVVYKISEAVTTALADPALRQKLVTMGMESAPLDSAAYGVRVQHEIKSFAPLVKELAAD